jgi:threonine/homoserine/homoserine lactone efflux protein
MIALGVRMLLANDAAEPASLATRGRYVETVFLTLTNPMTIVAYAAAIGLLAPLDRFNPATAAATTAGVFAGSLGWWIVLVSVVVRFRRIVSGSLRRAIDKLSAFALIGFGVKTASLR